MNWRDMVADGYDRAFQETQKSLAGLTIKDLEMQPHPDCNSIGWTAWHLVRGQDAQICDLSGEQQLWIKEKWHARYRREPDPDDTGYGDAMEEVRAFHSPGAATHIAYFRAVVEQSKLFLAGLKPTDLDKKLDEPWFSPIPTVGVRLVSIMADALVHAGEIDYLKGLLLATGKMKKRVRWAELPHGLWHKPRPVNFP
jgi:hypothetical protein